MSWAPLASYADVTLLVARLLVGVVMVYYGWPMRVQILAHQTACVLDSQCCDAI